MAAPVGRRRIGWPSYAPVVNENTVEAKPRPLQLMVGSSDAADGATVAEQARWAESVGFTHVAVHDHLGNRHAPIPLLTAVAMATERIGLCPLVLNNDLRHPAVLAQEL